MTKIAILGAGSIGCWIGGHLIKGGADVTLIGRRRYADQIAENGLRLTHFHRAALHLEAVDFQTDPAALEGADIIGLCVKSQDTAAAAQQILDYAPAASVVSFQNGIRNPEILRGILPPDHIVPAIVPFNVTPTQPGRFHCGTSGALILEDSPSIQALARSLEAGGQPVEMKADILGDQWAKMIVNLNNGLNTLSGGTLKEGLQQRAYRRALAACVEEAIGIARHNGVEVGQFNGRSPEALLKILGLPNWAYRLLTRHIVKIDAKARSSMLDDLEAGRPSEVEYLQGEIVKQAERVGARAPYNSAVLDAVNQAFEVGQSPRLDGSGLYNLLGV